MDTYTRIINSISRVLGLISMGFIVPMMLWVVIDVIARYVFNSPIKGGAEISITLMLFIPLGMAWAGVQRKHLQIDEIVKYFPKGFVKILDCITLIISFGMSSLIAWRLTTSTIYEFKHKGIVALQLPVPTYPFWGLTTLAWIVLALVLLSQVFEQIRKAVKK